MIHLQSSCVRMTAIADGTVLAVKQASGYGDVIVIEHQIESLKRIATYGHVDFSSARFAVGDSVKKGDVIAFLGEDKTDETEYD